MKKFSKFIAVSLASSMMLSTVALAAEGDYYHKEDGFKNVYYKSQQVRVEPGANRHVRVLPQDFKIEVEGKLYKNTEANEAFAKAGDNWKEYLKENYKGQEIDENNENPIGEIQKGDVKAIGGTYAPGDTLKFKVKDQERTVEELVAAGYTVTFEADEQESGIFADVTEGSKASSTGKLKAKINDINTKKFKFEVVVAKGEGKEKVEVRSERVAVEVKDIKELIKEIKLELQQEEANINGKLPLGQTADVKVSAVLQDGDKIEDASQYVDLISTKPLILEADSGKVTAKLIGKAEVIAKATNAESTPVSVEVVEKAKLDKLSLDKYKVALEPSETATLKLTAKDQYGKPFKGLNKKDVVLAENDLGAVATVEELTQNKDGSYDLVIKGQTIPESSSEEVIKKGKINVAGKETEEVEILLAIQGSFVDFRLEVDEKEVDLKDKDKEVKVKIIGIDKNGIEKEIGEAQSEHYRLKVVSGPAEVVKEEEEENNKLAIKLKDEAKLGDKIELSLDYKTPGELWDEDKAQITLTVVDSRPSLKDIKAKEGLVQKENVKEYQVTELFELVTSPEDAKLSFAKEGEITKIRANGIKVANFKVTAKDKDGKVVQEGVTLAYSDDGKNGPAIKLTVGESKEVASIDFTAIKLDKSETYGNIKVDLAK